MGKYGKDDGEMSCLSSQDKLGFNFKLKGETKESPHSTVMLTYVTPQFYKFFLWDDLD